MTHTMNQTALTVAGIIGLASTAFAGGPIGGYTVDNVETQFNQLAHHPDPIFINAGFALDADLCKHYQGMARYDGPDGTPYIYMVRSGNHTSACFIPQCDFDCSNDPGELIIARLGSRPKHGERLRSNILDPTQSFKDTEPPSSDIVMTSIEFDGTGGFPGWMHPGGMQIVDDVLVIAMEREWQGESDRGSLLFLDISDPLSPTVANEIVFEEKIGIVAITRDPEFGHYLIAFSGGNSETIQFHETVQTDLKAPGLQLNLVDVWNKNDADTPQSVKDKWEKWQTINFIRQTNGDLFFATTDNTDPEDDSDGANWSRLFKVTTQELGPITTFNFTYEAELRLKLDDPRTGNAAAAAGFHVTPMGNLLLYTGEHEDGGPDGSIRCGEIRSYNLTNYFGIDPDSWMWLEVYRDPAGWNDNSGPNKSMIFEVVDIRYENWMDLDDEDGWGDEPRSLRFRAPVGQQIMLFKNQDLGGEKMTLIGTGDVESVSLLSENFDEEIHSIFMGFIPASGGLLETDISTLSAYRIGLNYTSLMGIVFDQRTYVSLGTTITPSAGQDILLMPEPGATVDIIAP